MLPHLLRTKPKKLFKRLLIFGREFSGNFVALRISPSFPFSCNFLSLGFETFFFDPEGRGEEEVEEEDGEEGGEEEEEEEEVSLETDVVGELAEKSSLVEDELELEREKLKRGEEK